ncbi:hypothetical protein BKA62DRAFT_211322 [Auriculariales sp. MPI-PUGE-AT-0066]|nr:hypothetical protein BKA62DRAFT_211322 [Auriculariales sp. MPI-PUGE-AT-0066]
MSLEMHWPRRTTASSAVYYEEKEDLVLCFAGSSVRVTRYELETLAKERCAGTTALEELNLLIADSLEPLTLGAEEVEDSDAALRYLSAFSRSAPWITGHGEEEMVEGAGCSVSTIFLRHRYLGVRFEWHIDRASSTLAFRKRAERPSSLNKFKLITNWTAWKVGGCRSGTNPLVAQGHMEDILRVHKGAAQITQRSFFIDTLVTAEHFRSTALPLLHSNKKHRLRRFIHGVVTTLAEPKLAANLVAISALMSSVQGIAASVDAVFALVVSVLASVCATFMMVCIVTGAARRVWNRFAALHVDESSAQVEEQDLIEFQLSAHGQ